METIASFDINIQAVKRAVYYKNNIYLIEKDRISTHTTQVSAGIMICRIFFNSNV